MQKIGYVYDELMLLHQEYDHPECPERIKVIYEELKRRGYLDKMIKVPSTRITKEELQLVHSKEYIDNTYKLFTLPEKQIKAIVKNMDSIYANKNSLVSAEVAAGSTLNLMKGVLAGVIDHAVAIVRPPGHHCKCGACGGFCFFNNAAIATKYALNCGKRVAVVDWDIHEGDGTKNILKSETNALLISIHRYDYGNYYPGTGKSINQRNICYVPLNNVQGTDEEYYDIFDKVVIPKVTEFKPDIIVISAGFDAAEGDPLGGYHLSPNCYYTMTKKLMAFNKPLLLVLEGGYNLNSIAQSMAECVRCLLN